MPSKWKDAQYKVKTKKRTKLALTVLALIASLLILSWLIQFTKGLFIPVSITEQRNYMWNGEFNINLLVRDEQISLLTYNPKQDSVTIIEIPDEIFVVVPQGFGKWQLRAVYGLGGNQLLKDTLSDFLAVPIDGFLDFTALKTPKSTMQLVDAIRKNPFSGFNLISALKTDLTMWELLRLKLGISGVRFDKIKQLELERVLEKENLADGTVVLTSDPVRLDSVLSELADPAIFAENKTIAVMNATGRPQLAKEWARLITNLGGNVIITGNAQNRLEKTQVLGEESLTLKRLRQIFEITGKISASNDIISSRAQINVLLGEDI